MGDRLGALDQASDIHAPRYPLFAVADPVLRRNRCRLCQPAPTRFGPQLGAPITVVGYELEIPRVGNGITIDQERPQIHLVLRTLVVVCSTAIVGADRHPATVERNHFTVAGGALIKGDFSRRSIRCSLL